MQSKPKQTHSGDLVVVYDDDGRIINETETEVPVAGVDIYSRTVSNEGIQYLGSLIVNDRPNGIADYPFYTEPNASGYGYDIHIAEDRWPVDDDSLEDYVLAHITYFEGHKTLADKIKAEDAHRRASR